MLIWTKCGGMHVVMSVILASTSRHPTRVLLLCAVWLQVRPNEYVRFKKISLEDAFAAIFRTDALIDTLTAMAHGTITLEQGQSKMDGFKVG
mgnify:CR=1 FL=1